jgi:hypothetical protein
VEGRRAGSSARATSWHRPKASLSLGHTLKKDHESWYEPCGKEIT